MLPAALNRIDGWIARQADPQPTRPEAVRRLVDLALDADAPPASPAKRGAAAQRAKELAVGAVREALAAVDAPDEVKLERKKKLVAPPATGRLGKVDAPTFEKIERGKKLVKRPPGLERT